MCTASVTEGVPRWRRGPGLGWLTAGMRCCPRRRTAARTGVGQGPPRRTHPEISRLIGRSCRPASICGHSGRTPPSPSTATCCRPTAAPAPPRSPVPHVALSDAVTYLGAAGKLTDPRPLSCAIAAVPRRRGRRPGPRRFAYEEDSRAEVDMNVVATDTGTLVEYRAPARRHLPRSTLDKLLDAALGACDTLFALQREALDAPYRVCCPTVRRRRKPSAADSPPATCDAGDDAGRQRGGRRRRSGGI